MSAPSSSPRTSPPPAADAPTGELRPLLRLSAPLIAAHAGSQFMSVVDTAMVGRLGAAAQGGAGLAGTLWFSVSCLGLGVVLGAETLVAQAVGARDLPGASRAFGQALVAAVLVGAPLTVLLCVLPLFFGAAGIEPRTAHETARCLLGRAPQIIPFLLFAACRSYLQARGITRPVVLAMVLSNLLNVLFNLLLIYGDDGLRRAGLPPLGLPPLGVLGSGLSTSLAQLGALGLLTLSVRRARPPRAPRSAAPLIDPALLRRALRLGLPIAVTLLAEIGAFTLGSVLVGRISATASASHQVALTLASLSFTVTLGIGSAAAVRVGQHVGAGDHRGARRAGLCALALACAFMSASALTFLCAAPQLAALLTSDPVVIAAAAPLIVIAAAFQLFDGAQVTAAGALRGAGDTRAASVANLLGYYAFGIPLAVLLIPRLQASGVWWGLTLGLAVVAVALVSRFLQISARPIARA